MKKMTFLVNPPRRRGGSKARSSARKRVAAIPRRKRRPPPAGWSSWSAYMASIRPNAKRAAASTRGSIMSRKKGRRRSSGRHTRRNPAATASNPPRRRRGSHRRYRHNPPMGFKNIVPFAVQSVTGAGGVLAGKIIVRKARGLLGQKPGTIIGSVIEAAAGIGAGLLVQSFSPRYGALVAIGGVLSPMETLVQQMGIPHVSDSLADDGFLFGGDSGVELVSASDDNVQEFVTDNRGAGTLAEFVQAQAA